MRWYTHAAGAAAVALFAAQHTALGLSAELICGVLAGSVIADIDEPGSMVGRRTPGVSHIIKGLFGHRGITHTVWIAALLFLPYMLHRSAFFLGLGLGNALHVFFDMLSKGKVPIFYPFTDKRFGVGIYTVGGWTEHAIFAGFIAWMCVIARQWI